MPAPRAVTQAFNDLHRLTAHSATLKRDPDDPDLYKVALDTDRTNLTIVYRRDPDAPGGAREESFTLYRDRFPVPRPQPWPRLMELISRPDGNPSLVEQDRDALHAHCHLFPRVWAVPEAGRWVLRAAHTGLTAQVVYRTDTNGDVVRSTLSLRETGGDALPAPVSFPDLIARFTE